MRSAILCWAAGIWWLQCQSSLPSFFICCLLCVATIVCFCYARLMPRTWCRQSLFGAGAWCAGVAWAALVASVVMAHALPVEWEQRDIVMTGVVTGLPQDFPYAARFLFRVEEVLPVNGKMPVVPDLVSLSFPTEGKGHRVMPGQRWRFVVRLKRPHGLANPHGFDQELYWVERHVGATGVVRTRKHPPVLLDPFVPSISTRLHRYRYFLRERIRNVLAASSHAGIVEALVIGEQGDMTPADKQLFRKTGVSHLVAISGMHVTMVAGFVGMIAGGLWRRSLFIRHWQLPLLLPAQKLAVIAGFLAASVYVLLAGCGIPAQRAWCMLTVAMLGMLSSRRIPASVTLSIALFVVLLIDPWAILSPGFWMSFSAVACIVLVVTRQGTSNAPEPESMQASPPKTRRQPQRRWWQRRWHAIRMAVRVQWAVTIGLLPLSVCFFGQFSVVGPLANAVAIPAVTLLVAPAAVAGALLPGMPGTVLLQLGDGCLAQLVTYLAWVGDVSWAIWTLPVPPAWCLLLAAAGGVVSLVQRLGWWRYGGMLGLLPMFVWQPTLPAMGEARITALDIGQGMAVLVETAGHRMLYDTGPGMSATSNSGTRVIVPYLQAKGVRSLDMMIVSHADNDHVGGALSVMQGVKVTTVMTSLPEAHPVVSQAAHHQPCLAGQSWQWDGVTFEMLHPGVDGDGFQASVKTNARSCVLRISTQDKAILLAGDIEAAQEKTLVDVMSDQLPADVLLVPHHGSRTSSTLPFLAAVHPAMAIIQAGYLNRYRHPHPVVVDRYVDRGIKLLQSDRHGAIEMVLAPGKPVTWSAYRREHARYWYTLVGEGPD